MPQEHIRCHMSGEKRIGCDVPFKRKDYFKQQVPFYDWKEDDKMWEIPLAYFPQLNEMGDVQVAKNIAKKYNEHYGTQGTNKVTVDSFQGELYPFQQHTVGEMLDKNGMLVALDMGTGKCFYPSVTTLTNTGRYTVKKVFDDHAGDKVREDSDGGEWFSVDGNLQLASLENDGNIAWREPDLIYRQPVSERLQKITLADGSTTEITQRHPLLTPDGWTNDIEEGDVVAVPKETPVVETQHVDPDLAELVGWQIAEGWDADGYKFGIKKQDRDILEHIRELYMKFGFTQTKNRDEVNPSIYQEKKREIYGANLGCKEYRELLEEKLDYVWGRTARDKEIPPGIMQAQPEAKKRFLQAFIGTESWFSENERHMEFSTASETLARQVKSLLKEFGISMTLKPKEVDGYDHTYWRGRFGSRQLERYAERIGFGIEKDGYDGNKFTNPNTNGVPVSHHFKELNKNDIPTGLKAVYSKGTQEPSAEKLQESVEYLKDLVSLDEDAMQSRRGLTKEQKRSIMDKKDFIREKIEHFEWLLSLDVWWVEITTIEEEQYDGYVYDFQMPETHNYVAEDMLCHNTICTLSTGLELRDRDELYGNGRCLVVVPAALKKQWAEEIRDFSDAGVTVVDGGPDERPDQWDNDDLFTIVNYALLLEDDEPQDEVWGMVALDEASYIKNYKSKRTKKCKELDAVRKYALTGTPIENDLTDAYNILEFVDEDMFLGNYHQFKERYLQTEQRSYGDRSFEEVEGHKNIDELQTKLEPITIRYTKEEVADQLPPISTKKLFVSMKPAQWDVYNEIKQDMFQRIDQEKDVGAHVQFLRMVCDSSEMLRYSESDVVPRAPQNIEVASPKKEALKDLLDNLRETDHKALIFTQWKTMAKILQRDLQDEYDMVVLHGDHDEDDREMGLNEFKDENGAQFLLATDIFQYGVNIQEADYVIHFDSRYNPQKMAQRRDRVHRMGQENPVTEIMLLTEDTIEESVEETQARKQKLFDNTVGGMNDLSSDELAEMI